ncbi:MAG TPA: tripartite tricarboxylate transporter substrate-binding protein [Burkholderiales bacterium]|nr:tripartite tricarboxylate transporter substrate-binding protein [Burkholderiales bacterium]
MFWSTAARRFWLVAALLSACGAALAQAKQYPARPVTLVIDAFPRSLAGTVAGLLGERLTETWRMSVQVQRIEGTLGSVAAARVAKQPADGYVLLCTTETALTGLPARYADFPYEPLRDFTPISLLAQSANVLVVNGAGDLRSVPELIAFARQRPGGFAFTSAGEGTSQFVAGVLFGVRAQLQPNAEFLPSGTGAVRAVAQGQAAFTFGYLADVMPLVKNGGLRALAVASPRRLPALPDVPTMAEAGFKDFDATPWVALVGPAGMPSAVVTKLNAEVRKILTEPKSRERLAELDLEPVASSPRALAARMRTELEQRRALLRVN